MRPPKLRLDHIHVSCYDPEATADYYSRMFDADVVTFGRRDGRPRCYVELTGVRIHFTQVPESEIVPSRGIMRIGLRVQNLDVAVDELERRGAEIVERPRAARTRRGLKLAVVQAPDNVLIELLAPAQERDNDSQIDDMISDKAWPASREHPVKSLLAGHYQTALIYTAAKLHLADHLAERPQKHTELSESLRVDPDSLFRLMRGLVVLGLLTENDDGRFGLADWGHVLRSDAPGSLHGRAILAGEEYMRASLELVHAARTGELPFRTAFGMDVWQHRKDHPHLNQHFNDEMDRSTTALIPHILAVHDFSPYQTVVDIAGGQGLLLAEILTAYPHLNGVLFDQRHVLEHACRRPDGDEDRCTLVPGDMFKSIPEGGDVYLIKRILHDWDDERSVTILRNCRRAMRPGSRLLIVEMIAPDRAMDAPEVVMTDLHMLTITGGRERTAGEYRQLIHEAGLAWEQLDSAGPLFSIVQAVIP